MLKPNEVPEAEKQYNLALDKFTAYLKDNGLKMTRERRLILKEIFLSDVHLEAEDLLMRLRKRGEKVSRATIYRSFDLLIKANLIARSDFGHNHFHYEKNFGAEHHDHMICEKCGQVIEFSDIQMESLQQEICEKHQFKLTSHTLQIFGICKNCQNK